MTKTIKLDHRHRISIAAESIAAGVLSHAGLSVFVQYGANHPGYDLVASNDRYAMHISVKGSTVGGWTLCQKKKDDADYVSAYERWKKKHQNLVFCFVQFKDVGVGEMPRLYLVHGKDLAKYMRKSFFGLLGLDVMECYEPKRGQYKGQSRKIPEEWKMTESRIRNIRGQTTVSGSPVALILLAGSFQGQGGPHATPRSPGHSRHSLAYHPAGQ